MKRLRLKNGIKRFLTIILLMFLTINFINNFNNISQDELGNTCRGDIVKVCGN